MGRPGEKITRKTIMMQNKMKELDLKERSSKSLLANVLDMDDDFRCVGLERLRNYISINYERYNMNQLAGAPVQMWV